MRTLARAQFPLECAMPSTKTAADQIRGLKQELNELEQTLRQLAACRMDEGVAILYRYITGRIAGQGGSR